MTSPPHSETSLPAPSSADVHFSSLPRGHFAADVYCIGNCLNVVLVSLPCHRGGQCWSTSKLFGKGLWIFLVPVRGSDFRIRVRFSPYSTTPLRIFIFSTFSLKGFSQQWPPERRFRGVVVEDPCCPNLTELVPFHACTSIGGSADLDFPCCGDSRRSLARNLSLFFSDDPARADSRGALGPPEVSFLNFQRSSPFFPLLGWPFPPISMGLTEGIYRRISTPSFVVEADPSVVLPPVSPPMLPLPLRTLAAGGP